MTEAEWLAATDPTPMLEYLRYKASERKLRLFACACCKLVTPLLQCDTCLRAVGVAESHADGMMSEQAVADAREHVHGEWMNYGDSYRHLDAAASLLLSAIDHHPHQITWLCPAEMEREALSEDSPDEAAILGELSRVQPRLLRCIFGNPFRPVTADPSWLTSTVVSLAHGIYADRAFDRLPILADALQDAGCYNADILAHCRSDGPHARGCWVVDLVLRKQ
jgi:hypothetical protein